MFRKRREYLARQSETGRQNLPREARKEMGEFRVREARLVSSRRGRRWPHTAPESPIPG
jgi:hypothetical protein